MRYSSSVLTRSSAMKNEQLLHTNPSKWLHPSRDKHLNSDRLDSSIYLKNQEITTVPVRSSVRDSFIPEPMTNDLPEKIRDQIPEAKRSLPNANF